MNLPVLDAQTLWSVQTPLCSILLHWSRWNELLSWGGNLSPLDAEGHSLQKSEVPLSQCCSHQQKEEDIVKCFQVSKCLLVSRKKHSALHNPCVEVQRHVLKGNPQTAGWIKKSHQLLCFFGEEVGLDRGSSGGGGGAPQSCCQVLIFEWHCQAQLLWTKRSCQYKSHRDVDTAK